VTIPLFSNAPKLRKSFLAGEKNIYLSLGALENNGIVTKCSNNK
jgi:hypothetical protein